MTQFATKGEEEEIILPLPPKKVLGVPLTPDAQHWARKWSTHLAALSLSLKGATVAFIAGPPEWRAGFPVWAGVALLFAAMAVEALIPVATSIQQRSLRK